MYEAYQTFSFQSAANEEESIHEALEESSSDLTQEQLSPLHSPDEGALESVAVKGDSAVGQIDIIKQVHTTYREQYDELKQIGEYQAGMLKYFEEEQYLTLFVEGLVTSFESGCYTAEEFGRYHYWLLPSEHRAQFSEHHLVDEIQQLFEETKEVESDSVLQLQILGALGAASVYAVLNPSVSLYRTVSPEDDRKIVNLQNRLSPQSSRYAFLRDALRERLALNEVKCFLDHSPGERLALVYGASHDFSEQASHAFDKLPLIKTVDWPLKREHYTS